MATAVLLALIAVAPACSQRLDAVWVGTSWGESHAALLQHFGSRATVLPQAILLRVSPPQGDDGQCRSDLRAKSPG